jgi:hypothetical protein
MTMKYILNQEKPIEFWQNLFEYKLDKIIWYTKRKIFKYEL